MEQYFQAPCYLVNIAAADVGAVLDLLAAN